MTAIISLCQVSALMLSDVRHVSTLAAWSSLLGLVTALFMVVALAFFSRSGGTMSSWASRRNLMPAFCIVWLMGFISYDVGMFTGHAVSLLGNMPMAVLQAFAIFLLSSDTGAIRDEFCSNWVFMTFYSLTHFLAALVSMLFVVKHFGFNIMAGLRMFFSSHWGKKQVTYIFWGMNDASFHLARSIVAHHGADRNYRLIVVRTDSTDSSAGVRSSMERLFNFISMKNNTLDRLQQLDCLTVSTFSDLSQIELQQEDTPFVDIFRWIRLASVSRIIRRHTTRQVHLFFLSDDETVNIQSVAAIRHDKTINNFADQGHDGKVNLYCRARYNSMHRVVEDEKPHSNITVKVVDGSHISIEQLKQHVEFHPVSYVDIQPDATVSSPFHSLVAGFGDVGVDAVRFLHEFSSFVQTGSSMENPKRSPSHCDVVDEDMPRRANVFVAGAPALQIEMPFLPDGHHTDSPAVTLHHTSPDSVTFYRQLETWVKTLNLVILTLDDAEKNMALAVRILKMAIRYRANMEHFRILVFVRNDDGHIRRVARHYNLLCKAQMASDTGRHQQQVAVTDDPDGPITLFGMDNTVYQYRYIVSDELKQQAVKYKERYNKTLAEMARLEGFLPSWDDEYNDLMQLNEPYTGFAPTYASVMKLRRTQYQNFENCHHILTKRKLAREALGEQKYELLKRQLLQRKAGETSYRWKQGSQPVEGLEDVLHILARTEHLRWCASHEILGYTDSGTESDRDEARMQHGCLKPWQQLSVTVQSYDYDVVDVSVAAYDDMQIS